MKNLTFLAAALLLAFAAVGCDKEAGANEPIAPAVAPAPSSSVGVRPGTDGVPALPPGQAQRSNEGGSGASGSRQVDSSGQPRTGG